MSASCDDDQLTDRTDSINTKCIKLSFMAAASVAAGVILHPFLSLAGVLVAKAYLAGQYAKVQGEGNEDEKKIIEKKRIDDQIKVSRSFWTGAFISGLFLLAATLPADHDVNTQNIEDQPIVSQPQDRALLKKPSGLP